MKYLDNLKSTFGIITGGASVIGIIIGAYIGYTDILGMIGNNMNQIEKTQMMILKTKVRTHEKNVCSVGDYEWDEYIENYSMLYELKKKYKYISTSTPWKPIIRITKNTEDNKCKN